MLQIHLIFKKKNFLSGGYFFITLAWARPAAIFDFNLRITSGVRGNAWPGDLDLSKQFIGNQPMKASKSAIFFTFSNIQRKYGKQNKKALRKKSWRHSFKNEPPPLKLSSKNSKLRMCIQIKCYWKTMKTCE